MSDTHRIDNRYIRARWIGFTLECVRNYCTCSNSIWIYCLSIHCD